MSGAYKPYNVQCGCGVFNDMAKGLTWPITEEDLRRQSEQVRDISERIANSSSGFKRQGQSFAEIMKMSEGMRNDQPNNEIEQIILSLK